jgi:N-acetyl-alpha-D-glucosaminyl L-malate synthase BshA
VEDVVKIFSRIHKTVPSKLLFVGDGPERPAAESLSRDLHICDDIRFVGKQEQMEEILAIGDLFLLTSEYESFGLAALEAMAAGVPVISTNAGGLPEINIHGVTGFLGSVGDVESMSSHAISLLSENGTLEKFKANAYAQAKKFDIQNIVPKYEKLYDRFL